MIECKTLWKQTDFHLLLFLDFIIIIIIIIILRL